jgi:hypothetical protein
MDCVNDNEMVPTWQGTVVAKVTRVSIEEEDDDDDEAEFAAARASSAPQRQATSATSTPSAPHRVNSGEPLLDVFDDGHSRSAPVSAHSSTGNLLDVHAPAAAPTPNGSLLDMNTPIRSSSGNSVHNDFMGMMAPSTPSQPPQQQPTYNGYPNGHGNPQQQRPPQQQQQMPQQQRPPQQQQQQMPQQKQGNNAFDSFSSNQGPFGGLQWGN